MPDASSDLALTALRLGWTISELRGRIRPDSPAVESIDMGRANHAMPLADERSRGELELNAERVVVALAGQLEVDLKDPQSPTSATFSSEIQSSARDLLALRKNNGTKEDLDAAWDGLADLFYRWDERIQDQLSVATQDQFQGYQAGRALAEVYWALNPNAPNNDDSPPPVESDPTSWTFLFGTERIAALELSLGSVASNFHLFTAPAVAASFRAWAKVASMKKWRTHPDAVAQLAKQVARWRELVVLGRDPETLLKPYAALRSFRTVWRTFRAFFLQIIVGLGGLVLTGWFTYLLTQGSTSSISKVVTGFLALFGLSTASVTARLKNATQSVAARLRQDLYTELVAVEITVLPTRKSLIGQRNFIASASATRLLTAPLP